MYEEINRFILVPEHAASFDRLFETPEWRGIAEVSGPAERRRFIRELYEAQLKTRAEARYVRYFEMRNERGATDYFLFFATNNKTGLVKMKEAMWRVDPGGTFVFSDLTDPNQLVLFSQEPDYALLRRAIERRFGGRDVSVDDVEQFVIEHTAFLPTQYKSGVLRVMEHEHPPKLEILWAKAGRKRGTYPSHTLMRFVPN